MFDMIYLNIHGYDIIEKIDTSRVDWEDVSQ